MVVKLTSQNTVDWPGVGLKKKRKFQPLIKRRTVSSKIEGRGESEVTSGRGMRRHSDASIISGFKDGIDMIFSFN